MKLSPEGKDYQKELKPASSNQIMNLGILAQVFLQLICPDKSCRGRMHLYEQLLQDGLQKFLIVKCGICHRIAAEFPASLPIGCSAELCISNRSLHVRGQSEVNLRSLLAVHCTSLSWEDFRHTCSLLDPVVPTAAMSKVHMERFVESATSVVARSIKGSAEIVHSSLLPETSLPANVRYCTVSFDASWHRRGHLSNQGVASENDSECGKVLDYQLYDRVCYLCSNWNEERRTSNPEEYV